MRMLLCRNSHIRRGVCKRNSKVCHRCKKVKRILGSYVFYSPKNWSRWSEKKHYWLTDWNDYRWICRDCIREILDEWEIEPLSRMLIGEALSERKSLYVC